MQILHWRWKPHKRENCPMYWEKTVSGSHHGNREELTNQIHQILDLPCCSKKRDHRQRLMQHCSRLDGPKFLNPDLQLAQELLEKQHSRPGFLWQGWLQELQHR